MAGWHTTRWPYGMAEGKSKAYGKMVQGKMVHGKMSYVMADGKMVQGKMVHCNGLLNIDTFAFILLSI